MEKEHLSTPPAHLRLRTPSVPGAGSTVQGKGQSAHQHPSSVQRACFPCSRAAVRREAASRSFRPPGALRASEHSQGNLRPPTFCLEFPAGTTCLVAGGRADLVSTILDPPHTAANSGPPVSPAHRKCVRAAPRGFPREFARRPPRPLRPQLRVLLDFRPRRLLGADRLVEHPC